MIFNRLANIERQQIEREREQLKTIVEIINKERIQVLKDIDSVKDNVHALLERCGGKKEIIKKYNFLYDKMEESLCKLNNHKNYLSKMSYKDSIKFKDADNILNKIFIAKQDIAICKEFSFRLRENILIDRNN